MNALLRNGFRVGDWVVHPIEGTIVSGNVSHHLEPKVMDVLVCLAETPGQIRERDEILAAVWGQRAVSDEPLTRCIATLRRELGDDQRSPTYIQTIPKRGYRLVADVQPLAHANGARSKRIAGAAGLATVIALGWFLWPGSSSRDDAFVTLEQPVKIAVAGLASADDSPSANMLAASFSGQLAALLNRSGVVDALGFVTSNMPREKLSSVGATAILNGELDWTDDALRVDVELADLDGVVLWSRNFNGQGSDVFAIQNQIVADLAVRVPGDGLNAPNDAVPTRLSE